MRPFGKTLTEYASALSRSGQTEQARKRKHLCSSELMLDNRTRRLWREPGERKTIRVR